jgi:hypothetical protein
LPPFNGVFTLRHDAHKPGIFVALLLPANQRVYIFFFNIFTLYIFFVRSDTNNSGLSTTDLTDDILDADLILRRKVDHISSLWPSAIQSLDIYRNRNGPFC